MTARTLLLTGLVAAGKTTLAQALQHEFSRRQRASIILDAHEMACGLCSDLWARPGALLENMRRIAEVARLLNDQGTWAILALTARNEAARAQLRDIVGAHRFATIYLATHPTVCANRLHARSPYHADIDISWAPLLYDPPTTADLVLDTAARDVDDALAEVLGWLEGQDCARRSA